MYEEKLSNVGLFIIDFSTFVNVKKREVFDELTEYIILSGSKVFVSREFYENYEIIIKSDSDEQKNIAKEALKFLSKINKNKLLITNSNVINSKEIVEKFCSNPKVCFVYYCDSEFSENVAECKKEIKCNAIIVNNNGETQECNCDEILKMSKRVIDESVMSDSYFKIDFVPEKDVCVKTKDGEKIKLGDFLARGGEGSVFDCDYKGGYVAKIYHKGQLNKLRLKKLLLMEQKQIKYNGLCWPERVIYSMDGKPVGFIMKKIFGKNLSSVFDGVDSVLQMFPNWKKEDLIVLSLKILEKIQYLHFHGIIVGDLRFKNIVIGDDGEPNFVDLDSCQIRNLPCPIGFPDYTDPDLYGVELKKVLRTYSNESFSCSVVWFKILFCGIHPYNQRNGAETIEEEMRNKTFPYPENSRGDFSRIPLIGGYDEMWRNTPNQIQRIFYDIFKNNERYSVAEMILMTKTYLAFMNMNKAKIPSINNLIFD